MVVVLLTRIKMNLQNYTLADMDMMKLALRATNKNERIAKMQKRKKNETVVYKTNAGINFFIPSNMKEKSFVNVTTKNAKKIDEFKNSNKQSLIL